MIKLCQFPAVDTQGNQIIEVFNHPDMFHHSYMDKVAAPFLPRVREYIDRLVPDSRSIYALVNALGAYEYWSSNINGDSFEEEMLIHRGPVWGYETFEHYARPFMHHCFRAGTEVVMGDRTRKPIALVKQGELVETRLGPRQVKRAMARPYNGPGVRLSLAGVAEDLEGSWDHPVFVFQRDRIHCSHKYSRLRPGQKHFEEYPSCLSEVGPSPEEIPLGEVLPGDYMVFPRPKLGGERVSDKFAELVGWAASEGYCAGQRGMIQFTFCEFNYEDIKSVNDCLVSNGLHVTRTDLPDKEQVVLSSWSVELWDKLQEYVVGTKSEKHLTGKVLTWDERALEFLLGAYVDGDGHVPIRGKNEGQLRIRSSSTQMLHILSDVMRAFCVPTTVQWVQKPGYRTFPHGETYWCAGSGTVTVAPQFSPEITRRSRKHHVKDVQSFRPRTVVGDFFLVRVIGREDTVLNEDLYNLEVEGKPEYIAGEALVHNCNKGPNARAFGSVELSAWHSQMKRVELVVRLDREEAVKVNATRVIDKIDHGELPETSMGCFPAGTLVTMADWTKKPIEEVQVGDMVITHRGRARKVTEVHKRKYSGDLYSVKPEGGRILRPTRQHPFFTETESVVRPKDHKACPQWDRGASLHPEWVEARNLRDQFLLSPVPDVDDPVEYDVNMVRLLGFYLAEGYPLWNKDGAACGICLCTGWDDPIHDEIDEVCAALGLPEPWAFSQEERSGVYIHIFSSKVAEFCVTHAGRGASAKKLSPEMLRLKFELVLELLGKYGTGDGCFSSECLSFSTSSEDLAWQLAGLLPRIGVVPSVQCVTHKAGGGFNNHDTYEWIVHIGKSQAGVFKKTCSKIGEIDLIKPRFPRAVIDGYVVSPIREVSRLYVETDVFNLEVEEDESYLAEGQSVHNCKVPYDLCSITTDWELYRKALATYDPKVHRHPGVAALIYHKTVKPIRGLSVTRDDYSSYAKNRMNEILPDGRKVFVYNPFPRFFDISFVFIGAEKTSKMMAKLASRAMVVVPSSYAAEQCGYRDCDFEQSRTHKEFSGVEKVAGSFSLRQKLQEIREKKASQQKRAEITKDIVPSQFMNKAVPLLEKSEPGLSNDTLDRMGEYPLREALSTPTMMGITLKPREFQRITLVRLGKKDLADDLDRRGEVFGHSDEVDKSVSMGGEFISKVLASLLKDSVSERSAFGPPLRRRMIRITISQMPEAEPEPREVQDELLDKVSAAYNGYRELAIEKIASLSEELNRFPDVQAEIYGVDLEDVFVEKTKLAKIDPSLLLGAVPATYLASALARMRLRRNMARGESTGMLTQMLVDYPNIAATAVGLAALKATGSDIPEKLLKTVWTAGKRLAGLG
jgi:hypothetical protein